ncbi:TolC family protein [Pseudocolwellia agarivorans]|uniref:TolC family protein n=1 Tax=Pseudocolwellia agarivorans TaxID=1911682 RepID=UPI003F8847B2
MFINKLMLNGLLAFTFFHANATEPFSNTTQKPLSFNKAISTAQANDPWLTGNVNQQRSIEYMSQAATSLPDPKISINMANLPVNGFDFSQEAMTQAQVGISQVFPRGDSLKIKSDQLKTESEMYPYQRENRKSQVAVTVGSLWLDAFRVQESITLIETNRKLFEQLVQISEASYSSALGKTRQQDIVRAQLELTRLDDRLDILHQQKSSFDGLLSQWLVNLSQESDSGNSNDITDTSYDSIIADLALSHFNLSPQLPDIDLLNHEVIYQSDPLKPNQLVALFINHPSIIAIEKKVDASRTGISLAKQKYKPEWGVNASYGYRADDFDGRSRADLFSVGVTFDLPLFTENKQDKEVKSAIHQTEAVKTEKLLMLKQFIGSFASAKGRLLRLKTRQHLYKTKLLPQMHDQVEAALAAYTNNEGDFSEVVRSRIAVLNTEIEELSLNVEEQKIHLELNYLFVGSVNVASVKSTRYENQKSMTNSSQSRAIWGER